MTDMDAANEIKAWRHSLGWTQEEAATALDVPVQTVRAWEMGRYLPRHWRVLTLALAQLTQQQPKPRRKHPARRDNRRSGTGVRSARSTGKESAK